MGVGWCCCAQSAAPDTTRGWSSVPVIGAAVLGVVVRGSATDRRQAQQCTMPLAAAAAVSIFSAKRDTDGMAGNEQRAKKPTPSVPYYPSFSVSVPQV